MRGAHNGAVALGVVAGDESASAGRAPALQAGGRRFDPVILHHSSLGLERIVCSTYQRES